MPRDHWILRILLRVFTWSSGILADSYHFGHKKFICSSFRTNFIKMSGNDLLFMIGQSFLNDLIEKKRKNTETKVQNLEKYIRVFDIS